MIPKQANSLQQRNGVSRIFELKDYTTVSLSAGYDWKKFSIQGKSETCLM
jgi:iron complex outermembrane receptor protein